MCGWDMRVRQNQFEEILFGIVTKFDLFDLEEVKEGRALTSESVNLISVSGKTRLNNASRYRVALIL